MITKAHLNRDLVFKETTHQKIRAGTVRQISPSGKFAIIEEHNSVEVYDVGTVTVLEELEESNRPAGVPPNVKVVRLSQQDLEQLQEQQQQQQQPDPAVPPVPIPDPVPPGAEA